MWLVGLGVWLILQDALIFTVPSGQLAGRTEGWRHVSNRQEGRRMPQPFGWAWAAEQLCCQPLLCQPQPALFSASEQAGHFHDVQSKNDNGVSYNLQTNEEKC